NGNPGFDLIDVGDSATAPVGAQSQSGGTTLVPGVPGAGTGATFSFPWQHVNLPTTIASPPTDDTHLTLTDANASGGTRTASEWGFGTDISAKVNTQFALAPSVGGDRIARLSAGICALAAPISDAAQNSLIGAGFGANRNGATNVIWVGAHRGTMVTNSLVDDPL